jgi:predicted DNA binding CopG/RHH family protein
MERQKTILIRCSKEEKAIIRLMADKKGLPIATYIRSLIVNLYYEGKKNANAS